MILGQARCCEGGGAAIWPARIGVRNRSFSRMAQHTSEKQYGICNALRENLVLRLFAVYFVDISMLHPTHYASWREKALRSAKTVHLAEILAKRLLWLTTGVIIFKST